MSQVVRNHKVAIRKLEIAQNQIKSFKYFYDFPAEVRMMVVDEMGPIDRCRFKRCSILSSMEAKRSKNSMNSLQLHCFYDNLAKITVIYDNNGKCGFDLKFLKESGKKCMKYTSFQNGEFWRTEFPESTDLVQLAAEYFKDMLRDYQNSIKVLKIQNYLKNEFDFGFKNLNNLEVLDIRINSSILPAISKIRKPLKALKVYGEKNNRELENFKISRISEQIDLPDFKLNYEQFIQLSATDVTIHIGYLTEEDIFKIIESWQNRATGDKVINYKWNLKGSNFDVQKLQRLFGADDLDSESEEMLLMSIEHGFEKRMRALLTLDNGVLEFVA